MRLIKRVALLSVALLSASLASVTAQSTGPVPDTVQEDWQLVVNTPDIPGVGPQITTCMRPGGPAGTAFVAFDLNYKEYPDFSPGGMQVQVWSNNQIINAASQKSKQLQYPNETITWTQQMSVDTSGNVWYEILNGNSTTWGQFGQGYYLNLGYSSNFSNMSGYSPDTSVANSGVTWEKNLAGSLILVQVRYYANGTLISTDTNPRSINLSN